MMRSLFIAFILIVSAITAAAQGSNDAVLRALVTRGNRAYELNQRSLIKKCADSIAVLLDTTGMAADALKDYQVSLFKLYGNYHYENGSLDSAEIYYNRAGQIIENNSGTDFSGNDLLMLREFSQLYYRQGKYEKALQVMERADELMEYNGSYRLGDDNWLTAKLTYAMCLARVMRFDEALSIAETEIENALNKNSLAYARALRMLGKIRMLADVDKSGALHAYKEYFNAQKAYSLANFAEMTAAEREEYWQALRPFIADCYQLENADPAFLYDVTLYAKGLLLQLSRFSGKGKASDRALQSLGYRWTDIQKKLAHAQAAVEFIQYEKGGRSRMAAILLKNTGRPKFISMTSPDEILNIAGEAMASTSRNGKDALYSDSKLQKLVWTDSLLEAISGIKKLYFAPDGYMHRLAIEYMPQVSGIRLCRLTSTRRLMEDSRAFSPAAPMLLFGGINYELDRNPALTDDNDSIAYTKYKGTYFPRLSAASDECKALYASRHIAGDSLLTASAASEYAFRSLAPDYGSILISSHGDFCGDSPVPNDIRPVSSDAAMSGNIIALAGVNTHLQDHSFEPAVKCDGLLSVKELSSLDLSECRLFTVSACQSALGEISSDGVFGLQRGLKNAGVGAMILSLWNVNSEATAMLMKHFYSFLNIGMSIREAFEAARAELSAPQPENSGSATTVFDPATMASRPVRAGNSRSYASPQYLNAFIVIDAPE